MKAKGSWKVVGRAFDRITGEPVGSPRVEIVDIANMIFAGCVRPLEVKMAYEAFWNELNSNSAEVVFVSEVTPIV